MVSLSCTMGRKQKEICRICGVNFVKNIYSILNLKMKHSYNLGNFIQSIMLAFEFNAYLFSLPFVKPIVSCLFLAVFKQQLSKREKKNGNWRNQFKYNFFWGVHWFTLNLLYFFSNLASSQFEHFFTNLVRVSLTIF